jgi:hypothetical protein
MRTSVVLVVLSIVVVAALPAGAQTNLGIGGGLLMPVGDFGDVADVSPYVGARWEMQDVNALGQVAVLSLLVQGGFAFLQTDSDLERSLDEAGESDDGGYFDIGLGARMYSSASPLFVSVGGSYVNLDAPGPGDSENGGGLYAGAGLVIDTPSFKIDIEGRANVVFISDDNLTHFQVLAAFGFPFE